jgi:dipeptidyl aminopeptidase/acylaminoacyl peptidase
MSPRNDLLEHAMDLFPTSHDALDGVFERHHRRQRNKRLAAGAVGLAIAIAVVVALSGAGVLSTRRPVGTPTTVLPGGLDITPHQVETIGLDGSTLQTFVGLPEDAFEPALSPDGSTLAFVHTDGSLTYIATIGTDGTGMRVLTEKVIGLDPVWSPDGSRIAFVGTRPLPWNRDIWVVDADGTNLHRITHDPWDDRNPEWSPGGKRLAFVRHPASGVNVEFADSVDIWVVPVAGGRPTRLTNDPGWSGEPTWSPDGDRIAYARGEGSTTQMWVMDADGSNKHPLTPPRGPFFALQWSPGDASKIALLRFEGFNSRTIVEGTLMPSVAVGSVQILDVPSGRLIDLGVRISSSDQRARWLPSGDALLVDRLVDAS